MPISKKELHTLLEDKELNNIPILILGNKIDVKPHLDEKEIIEGLLSFLFFKLFLILGLNLDYIHTNSWLVVMISALKGINLPEVIDWLIKKSKK